MISFVTGLIGKSGALGVMLLMLLENLVPVIPSELVLPLAGLQAARGQFQPVVVILAATAGSAVGGAVWYAIGRSYGLERLQRFVDRRGRWLPVTSAELGRADVWFKRWGWLAVLVGRALPGVRGVICIPAGVAAMPLSRFLLSSTVGAALWSALLIGAGYVLKAHYTVLEAWLNPAADAFVGLCLLVYAIRMWRRRRR